MSFSTLLLGDVCVLTFEIKPEDSLGHWSLFFETEILIDLELPGLGWLLPRRALGLNSDGCVSQQASLVAEPSHRFVFRVLGLHG